ncbi:hypothetical protein F2Q69_00033046 [Brassica cretica]|uniref:Uncharacterized protein n=1 Tax=Brassica cretica TaxID=69181 RepID=A0A8S9SRR4_BRACR|nr:hypothetical protein F2Q69_00033046 [Brassica cretica]
MGEAQGLDQGARQVLDLSDLTQNLTKALGITIPDGEGSKDQAPRGLDKERKGDQRDVNYGGLKSSWVGAVQGITKEKENEEAHKEGMEKQKESETKSNHEGRRGSISPEKENGRKTKETESEGNQEGEGNQAEWLDVSPGKASRSPPRFGQVSILTKYRFEVLSPAEDGEINEKSNEEEELLEGEELLEEEKLLEAEDSGEEIEEKEELVVRQKLPRDSKMNHRYLRGTESLQICFSMRLDVRVKEFIYDL